ncbi:hypothetical protein Q4595_27625, partial [Wenyingzhuangia sp. 1_MG-2023]|nr:hypothetical protein [Wenyingzhuangia sp. 1_MG-2023]
LAEAREQQAFLQEELEETRLQWQEANAAIEQYGDERDQLLQQRDSKQQQLDDARALLQQQQQAAHQAALGQRELDSRIQSLNTALQR